MRYILLLLAVISYSAAGPEPSRIIVFEFDYAGGDPGAAAGIAREIRQRLAQEHYLQSIDPPKDQPVPDALGALYLAGRLSADYLLTGSILQIGGSYDITYDLIKVKTGARMRSGRRTEPWDAGYAAIAALVAGEILEQDSLFPVPDTTRAAAAPDSIKAVPTPGPLVGDEVITTVDSDSGETIPSENESQTVNRDDNDSWSVIKEKPAPPNRNTIFNLHAGGTLGYYPLNKLREMITIQTSLIFKIRSSYLAEIACGMNMPFQNINNNCKYIDFMAYRVIKEDNLSPYIGIGLGYHFYQEYQLFPWEHNLFTIDIGAGFLQSNPEIFNVTPELKMFLVCHSYGISPEISIRLRLATPWFRIPKIVLDNNESCCCIQGCANCW